MGSTFEGVSFVGSFDGWNIIGANFTGSRGARIDLEKVLDTSEKKINDLSNQLNQHIEKLEAIISFISELEQIVH